MVITQVSMAGYDLATHGTILLSKVNIKELRQIYLIFTYIRLIYMSMQPLQNLWRQLPADFGSKYIPVQIWQRSEFSFTFSKRFRLMYSSPSSFFRIRGLSMFATRPTPNEQQKLNKRSRIRAGFWYTASFQRGARGGVSESLLG